MVAVFTAALMSAAEISNYFSALGVLICFICMVIFILRLSGDDLLGATSVVHMTQPAVVQVAVQKVQIPFSLELCCPQSASFNELQLKVNSTVSYRFISYWGVTSVHLHQLLMSSWSSFYLHLTQKPSLLTAQVTDEPDREDVLNTSETVKTIGVSFCNLPLNLGASPRTTYPLVVCLVKETQIKESDLTEVGALICVIHIKDAECQIPTSFLHQYLKQYNGQFTRLQALYTQADQTTTQENSEKEKHDSNVKISDVNQEPSRGHSMDHDIDEIPIDEACVVCQVKRITRALLPCRHVCVCSSCGQQLKNCPMCRTKIVSFFLTNAEYTDTIYNDDDPQLVESHSIWMRFYSTLNGLVRIEN